MVFLGCLYNPSKIEIVRKKSRVGLQNAANAFQWSLLNGLEEIGEKVTIINVLPVGNFPKEYNQLLFREKCWSYDGFERNYDVGFVNLPIIKQLNRAINLKRKLKTSHDTEVIVYSTDLSLLIAAYAMPSNYSITLIVTDLPEYYDLHQVNWKRRLLRKFYNRYVYRLLNRVDNYVLLTEAMKERLPVGDKPYVVVEGIASVGKGNETNNLLVENKAYIETKKTRLLYTGTLNKRFGVENLLQAMKYLDDSYELLICGKGELERELIETKGPNVNYLGQLDRNEVLKLQREADLLINPRDAQGEYTKYSFPSKTMEYLLSGTPIVMYKLPGIPDEYDEFLNYFHSDDPKQMADIINRVTSDNSCKSKARRGKEFVSRYKDAKSQAMRVVEMIRSN